MKCDFAQLPDYLHLDDGVYKNPYELMTFYDNHDMARMAADEDGFIDANNWLFTSRGIPVVYYGSEIAFMAGAREHGGNRNYFGQANVARAKNHRIHAALSRIAKLRAASVALQRGLQLNLSLAEDTAAFYRVYRRGDEAQTALVLLNKSDQAATIDAADWLHDLDWRDALTGLPLGAGAATGLDVDTHGVRVLLAEDVPAAADVRAELQKLQSAAVRN